MTLTGILVLLLIAGIVGALGQTISGYSFGGCLMSIIVGFVGAYVGVWLAGQLGLPEVFTINVEGEVLPDCVGYRWIGHPVFDPRSVHKTDRCLTVLHKEMPHDRR